jgi:hypothetical protein
MNKMIGRSDVDPMSIYFLRIRELLILWVFNYTTFLH